MTEPARSLLQRKKDALHRLATDRDLWISSASAAGVPRLVPLNFWWNEKDLFVTTVKTNPTAQNIIETGRVVVSLGHSRDVVLIEALAKILRGNEFTREYGDSWVAKCGWDPRTEKGYELFQLTPQRIESWRELNEHKDRELMRDGNWLV